MVDDDKLDRIMFLSRIDDVIVESGLGTEGRGGIVAPYATPVCPRTDFEFPQPVCSNIR